MSDLNDFNSKLKKAERLSYIAISLLAIASILISFLIFDPTLSVFKSAPEVVVEVDEDAIENGIHLRTGFVDDEGLMTVVNNCTNCHSSKLVIQNRMNKERWNATIRWMQESQNLWELGDNQEIIVNYLVKNYPPIDTGRRENLKNINWYELEE